MDELSKKFAKIVELQKCKNSMRGLAIATLISLIVTGGSAVKALIDYDKLTPEELTEIILSVKGGEYSIHCKDVQDRLTDKLCQGEINTQEYSNICRSLKSEEGIVEWAKTLNDDEVDEVIKLYNMAKRDRLLATISNTSLAMCSGGITAYLASKYFNKRDEYNKAKKSFDKEYQDGGYIPR